MAIKSYWDRQRDRSAQASRRKSQDHQRQIKRQRAATRKKNWGF